MQKMALRSKTDRKGTASDDEAVVHNHRECLQKIKDGDKKIQSLKREIATLKELNKTKTTQKVNFSNHNLEQEKRDIELQLKEEREKNLKLEAQILNNSRPSSSHLYHNIDSTDVESMEIITPLKKKIEKKESEILALTLRLQDLETENTRLYQTIANPATSHTTQEEISQNRNSFKDESNKLKKKLKKMTQRLSNTLKDNYDLTYNLNELKAKEISLSKLHQTIRLLQKKVQLIHTDFVNTTEDTKKTDIKNTIPEENTDHNPSNGVILKPNLLLLSDLHGTELAYVLSKIRKNDYNFMADIINLGTTERIMQNIELKTRSFTKKDCVVIMCGGSDYKFNNISCITDFLINTLKKLSNTNVVLCNVPCSISYNSKDFNSFVSTLNYSFEDVSKLYNYVHYQIIDNDLESKDFQANGFKLKQSGKFKIARALNQCLKTINEKFYNSLNFL